MEDVTRYALFRGVDADEARAFIDTHAAIAHPEGAWIVREGDANDAIHLIEEGRVGIWRNADNEQQRVKLATLEAGDSFGEMSALENETTTATLIAETPVRLRRFTLADLPKHGALREQVPLNIARSVVGRLARTNDTVLRSHLAQLHSVQVQLSISIFLTKTLVALALYIFLMPVTQLVKPYLPSDSIISIFFIVTYLVVSMLIVRQSALAPHEYGVTSKDWPRAVLRGVMLTLPVMALLLSAKYALVLMHPDEYTLFEPWRATGTATSAQDFDMALWLGFTIAYIVLSFAQEFIRCAIQGSLGIFYRLTGAQDRWKSVLVANVVFAALHTHLSPIFALIVFVPGLFWGWMYHRERSFIGVAVSHAVLGTWAVFVLGVPY